MSGHNSGRTTSGQGAVGRGFRVQIPVPNSDLASILCGPRWPWPTRLLGVSNRPGDRLEASADGRLGLLLIIILGGLSQLIRTCAWRQTLQGRYQRAVAGHAVLECSWPRMRAGNLVLLGNWSGRGSAYLC